MSQIRKIRTLRVAEHANVLWVEVETDEGLVGLGETFRGADAVESVIHGQMAPALLGQDARHISRISRTLSTPYLGFHSTGAETRAASAIDIALWDLAGQRLGIPVHEALGGTARDAIAVYNTCAGYAFNSSASSYNAGAARRITQGAEELRGPYDDQVAFMKDAGELARSLLDEGYAAMKIWPFDAHAAATGGNAISLAGLKAGLEPFRKVREAVGDRIEIMAELHSLWSLPAATRICQALEEYGVLWAEDPICKMDDFAALAELRARTRTPLCGSETLAGLPVFRALLASGAIDYAMLDLSWCGGLTEGRKIAALAESHAIPIAPHDCTGPVVLWAGLHLALHAPMGLFQEVVRANLATWYGDFVETLPEVRDGRVVAPTAPGLGTRLRTEARTRPDATLRETAN